MWTDVYFKWEMKTLPNKPVKTCVFFWMISQPMLLGKHNLFSGMLIPQLGQLSIQNILSISNKGMFHRLWSKLVIHTYPTVSTFTPFRWVIVDSVCKILKNHKACFQTSISKITTWRCSGRMRTMTLHNKIVSKLH